MIHRSVVAIQICDEQALSGVNAVENRQQEGWFIQIVVEKRHMPQGLSLQLPVF